MIDLEDLLSRQPRPWKINVPPPRDRFFEVMHRGTRLIAIYSQKNESWTIGTDLHLEREEITHWRECSDEQLAEIRKILARP